MYPEGVQPTYECAPRASSSRRSARPCDQRAHLGAGVVDVAREVLDERVLVILRALLAGLEGLAPHLVHRLERSIATRSKTVTLHRAPPQALAEQRVTSLLVRALLLSSWGLNSHPAVLRRGQEDTGLVILLALLLRRAPLLVRRLLVGGLPQAARQRRPILAARQDGGAPAVTSWPSAAIP